VIISAVRYIRIDIVLERVLVLIFSERIFFNEKNVVNLITFSWCTLSALLYCDFVGRQEICSNSCLLVNRLNSSALSPGPLHSIS